MRYIIAISLLLGAFIHLLPMVGVIGAEQLARLYGVALTDPDLLILMRHRAVLFGLLGVFLAVAAFVPALRTAAFIAGLVSAGSFLVIALGAGGYNAQLGRVVTADVVAVAVLAVGSLAHVRSCRRA